MTTQNELAVRAKWCPVARAALMDEMTPLVRKIVFSSGQVAREIGEDLFQAGYMGLLEALDAWDPTNGAKFGSYAWNIVKGAVSTEARTMRLGHISETRWTRDQRNKILTAQRVLQERMRRMPTTAEVAAEAGMQPATVEGIWARTGRVAQIDTSESDHANSLSAEGDEPYKHIELYRSIESLPQEVQNTLVCAFEIAPALGAAPDTSPERVNWAVAQLRRAMVSEAVAESLPAEMWAA